MFGMQLSAELKGNLQQMWFFEKISKINKTSQVDQGKKTRMISEMKQETSFHTL